MEKIFKIWYSLIQGILIFFSDSLQRYFEQFGEVKESVFKRDPITNRSR